jgi:predicted transcriptional regulator
MASAKEEMIRVIQQQPDDSSYEEILRELALARMIECGLEDAESGRTISDSEMQHRIRTWRK